MTRGSRAGAAGGRDTTPPALDARKPGRPTNGRPRAIRPPRRVATPVVPRLQCSPPVQDWLDFLTRLLVQAALDERAAGTTPGDRPPGGEIVP
jgi:hypothetical protein